MIEICYADMHRMITDGCSAYEYAWRYYDKLVKRSACYTLYGPSTNYLGVMAAGHLTPAKERHIQKTTRRKNYIMYELDQNFHVLRIRHMKNYNEIDCTYHLFERNGVIYGRPFFQDQKIAYPGEMMAIKYSDGRPQYFAMTRPNYLCVDFYEYPQSNRVSTTCYLYHPASKYTSAGIPASWDSPFGTQNSPVTLDILEEEYCHINFEEWCK